MAERQASERAAAALDHAAPRVRIGTTGADGERFARVPPAELDLRSLEERGQPSIRGGECGGW